MIPPASKRAAGRSPALLAALPGPAACFPAARPGQPGSSRPPVGEPGPTSSPSLRPFQGTRAAGNPSPQHRVPAEGTPTPDPGAGLLKPAPGRGEASQAPSLMTSAVSTQDAGTADPGGRGGTAAGTVTGTPPVRQGTGTVPAGRDQIAAKMSEDRGPDSLDAHVRRYLKELGLMGYHTRNSRGSAKGYPDWTIAGLGGVLFRELKTQRGTVTPEQVEWLGVLTAAGADVDVWRPEDLLSGRIASELAALAGLRGTG